ncbi:methionine--tRNA ligase [Candidatus Nomurabacteria bacterium]|nr:methionine--tRNA ligase [Candidatus Nomurabacteria bacterium]
MSATPFYITTTLPYVNAPLHMGHALEFIRADALARYKMLQGYDVFFNTGTDEHGQKIAQKATEQGVEPQAFVDAGFATFKKQVAAFGINPEAHFVRTTDVHHVAAAQEFWRRVDKNGYIYKKNYQAKYCVGCESEKTDSELVDGRCPLHPTLELELIDEKNYFFKLSALQNELLALYERTPDLIVPEFRFNEMKAFIERGLEDFSISRLADKMSWGVAVPDDDTQVMYVWFDALTNYISTLGWPEQSELFDRFWVQGTPTQYCGKDNTRFQGIIWQAMLIAAGLPTSRRIIVNGFITGKGGVRMSKTLGNVVDPLVIAKEYGTDALRLFLLKEVSSFEDSPFAVERFREACNANLANGLGNLASRILTLAEKYIEPVVVEKSTVLIAHIAPLMESFDIQKALAAIWEEIADMDKTIAQTRPFAVIKEDEAKGRKMITHLIQRLAGVAYALTPFLPDTSARILSLIRDNKKPDAPLFVRLD